MRMIGLPFFSSNESQNHLFVACPGKLMCGGSDHSAGVGYCIGAKLWLLAPKASLADPTYP